jgi:AAA domain
MNREFALKKAFPAQGTMQEPPVTDLSKVHPALKEVSTRVVRYFREFLESDFRKAQAPRRRIQLKNQAGFRCGIDLRKYPALFKDAWALSDKPSLEMTLSIKRRKYKAEISPVLKNLVQQYVDQLNDGVFQKIRQEITGQARISRHRYTSDPDLYVESVVADLQKHASSAIVRPLLALLEGTFKESAHSAEESVFEMEAELTASLCSGCVPHMAQALNTLMLQGDEKPFAAVLGEFFCAEAAQPLLIDFFEAFAAADVLQELRDLINFAQSDDTLTTYLYFGSFRFGPNDYPLFYMPVSLRQQAEDSGYDLVVEPKLYINKQAIDHIAASMNGGSQLAAKSVIDERIIHLGSQVSTENPLSALAHMERMRLGLERTFDLATKISFTDPTSQAARSTDMRMSNAVHLAVFDRSDESLVNDYEAILSGAQADHQEAASFFTGMIGSMLFNEPVSITEDVRQEWNRTDPARRLVPDSPIPLNEEQIRIDMARRQGTRFIAVEGPPGSGKSHTITALAFNAIMDHQSVLIVSDKNEALDVVQDKLTSTLQSIRHGEDFPNPILRLGKDGTYRSLISASSKAKIESHHLAQDANMPDLETELEQRSKELRGRVEATVKSLSEIQMSEVHKVLAIEAQIGERMEGGDFFLEILASLCFDDNEHKVSAVKRAFLACPAANRLALQQAFSASKTVGGLVSNLKASVLCKQASKDVTAAHLPVMAMFKPLKASQAAALMATVARVNELKRPVVGLMFRGKELAAIDAQMVQDFGCTQPGMAQKIAQVQAMAGILGHIGRLARDLGVPDEHTPAVSASLLKGSKGHEGAQAAVALVLAIHALLKGTQAERAFEGVHAGHLMEVVFLIGECVCAFTAMSQKFDRVPHVDFVGEKAGIERMHTARLAHRLDSRFLHFVENHRATAQALGGVIKARTQFPTDQFASLRDAFPCAIAGIRELGEFVPLKTAIFDLVIIDEGSQVSIAQAMPVMLRARQVIVFGDRKQFANVKSHNASKATNAAYLSDMQSHFRQNVSTAVDKLERLQRFDVKRSVLEFVELVAGHSEMLRKHFRGYPELISFSSKNFYDGALQAIKVRAKPIDEVLRFEVIESLGDDEGDQRPKAKRSEGHRNVNISEGERILELLQEMLQGFKPPSVGIITPFTEQAAHLSSIVSRHPDADRFERELRIKVMTADSCQGEERDVIIFSMVATRERDVLNFIFPVQLKIDDDENDTLKAQRLNVAFSRAKECMIFVLSKPPEEFTGTLGQALMHYKRILNDKSMAQLEEVDPSSPMEAKVLHWLKSTRFFQVNAHRIELIAQFPVGDYLRQLDPGYKHPRYKVDFLLRYRGGDGKVTNVVIEYDGFKEHFTDLSKVNASNFESYYKPQDVERQYVLESYGLKFLRINRFNLGADPVVTLDRRISDMVQIDDVFRSGESNAVDRIRDQARDLENKDAKPCPKCGLVKEKQAFFDPTLGRGIGGYGRMCMVCKRSSWSGTKRPV